MSQAPTPPPATAAPAAAADSAATTETVKTRASATRSVEDRALEWVKAAGMPLAAALITVVGGFLLKSVADQRAERESRERLYTQLLVQREQSDAAIRKDMFGVVLKEFLAETSKRDWKDKVLQLELLAHNFSQTLDLAPLFKDVARRLPKDPQAGASESEHLLRRLDLAAAALNFKQVNGLARRGFERNRVFPVGAWLSLPDRTVFAGRVRKAMLVPEAARSGADVGYSLEVIGADLDQRELEVRLRIDFSDDAEAAIDRHFWVGPYDFPMLDNTQLPYGLRASVVITSFDVPEDPSAREAESNARIYLVIFPASSASFKERQDYDDLLRDMLREHDLDQQRREETARRILDDAQQARINAPATKGSTP
jgi:hypothetical protein